MELNITWSALVGAVFTYYGTVVFYRLLFHPLARFPGPRLAAATRWYEAYYDVAKGGKYTLKIAEMHKKYGPIIRISPFELHVNDPTFFEKLYRTDGRWHKYSWAYDAFETKTSTVFYSDHDAHKRHRAAIAPFFSKANVAARQGILHGNIEMLCQRISGFAGTTFNLGSAVSAFTRDNANAFIIGKSYGDLGAEDLGFPLTVASQGAGSTWRTTKHFRWFAPLIRSLPIDWVIKVADEPTKSFLHFLKDSEQDTRSALDASISDSGDTKAQDTMIHAIVNSNLPPHEKEFNRVFEEVATVTGAAYETTANTLRLIVFHIFSNQEVLRKLREELASMEKDPQAPFTLKELEPLPYLTTVLMEGLRLSPGIASRAARITDNELVLGEWRIPPGIPVGMTTILMHTDERLYPDPLRFDPNRWIGPTARRDAGPNWAPFSRGTRNCLGMHLAWAEMYLFVAALVQNFTFEITGASASDFELDRDNFAIGTKAGCNLMAHVTPHRL